MKKILTIACGILLTLTCAVAADPCSDRPGPPVELKRLKANPEKFEAKTIRVSGVLKSGHLGVALGNAKGLSIRIRAHDELKVKAPLRVCENALYKRFWSLSETPTSDDNAVSYLVDLEGVVRILKNPDGTPAKEFSVFGQWPVELVATRVFSISERRP